MEINIYISTIYHPNLSPEPLQICAVTEMVTGAPQLRHKTFTGSPKGDVKG